MEEKELAKLIGKTIAARRIAANLTQEQVAERLGIGSEAVSRMERGTVMPTIARLIDLAKTFDCHVSELLTEASYVANDQAKLIAELIQSLSDEDRLFVLDLLKQLVSRLKA